MYPRFGTSSSVIFTDTLGLCFLHISATCLTVTSSLTKLKVSTNEKDLECLYKKWSICDSINVKEVEDITKHDVKALEYYLNIKLEDKKLEDIKKYVHWGLTSQDVNHVSQTYLLKEFTNNLLINKMGEIIYNIRNISKKSISMLSHTHGQPASPTVFEKEMLVFITRLEEHLNDLKKYKWKTKFGGAVGNLNAHKSLIKNINWEYFCDDFLYKFDLERHKYTTQIDNYDYLSIYWADFNICVLSIFLLFPMLSTDCAPARELKNKRRSLSKFIFNKGANNDIRESPAPILSTILFAKAGQEVNFFED